MSRTRYNDIIINQERKRSEMTPAERLFAATERYMSQEEKEKYERMVNKNGRD